MTFEEGSLLEPLSVALAGIDRSKLTLGTPLIVCGAGPIGLVSLLAAHAAGAAPIVISDLDENRLQKAKELVPRVRTVLVAREDGPKELAQKLMDKLGRKAHLVLECTGVESSIHAAIYVSPPEPLLHRVSSLIDTGFRVRWLRLCYRRRERLPEHTLHASLSQRDRSPIPV